MDNIEFTTFRSLLVILENRDRSSVLVIQNPEKNTFKNDRWMLPGCVADVIGTTIRRPMIDLIESLFGHTIKPGNLRFVLQTSDDNDEPVHVFKNQVYDRVVDDIFSQAARRKDCQVMNKTQLAIPRFGFDSFQREILLEAEGLLDPHQPKRKTPKLRVIAGNDSINPLKIKMRGYKPRGL